MEDLFELHRNRAVNPNDSDIIIMILHSCLVKPENHFRFLGLGQKPEDFDKTSSGSYVLPTQLKDEDSKLYELTYARDQQLIVLLGTVNNNSMMTLILRNQENFKETQMNFDIKDILKSTEGESTKMVPEFGNFVVRLQRELIDPLITQPSILEWFCTSPMIWNNRRAISYTVTPVLLIAVGFWIYLNYY